MIQRYGDMVLHLTHSIGTGATREIFVHPDDPSKCIKVTLPHVSDIDLANELAVYRKVKNKLQPFIVRYDEVLVPTNKGMGLVCEMVRDDNGSPSRSLMQWIGNGNKINSETAAQLNGFVERLLHYNLFFSDFNQKNFLIQIQDGKPLLRYIDLKSFRVVRTWTFLKMERFVRPLARRLVVRRLKHLYGRLGLGFPDI